MTNTSFTSPATAQSIPLTALPGMAFKPAPDLTLARRVNLCYNPLCMSTPHDRSKEDTSPSDDLCIARILDGDTDAFAVLVHRYKMYVLKIVNRHIPYEDAEEVAHDAFIRTFESLKKFKGPEGFRQWMAAITTRTCYDYWRRAYRSKEMTMSSLGEGHLEWLDAAAAGNDSIDDIGRQVEARDVLNWALAKLSPEDRMVLELVYLEGLSVREVADLLGWSMANVKIRSFRSRNKLHKLLRETGRR